MSRPTLPISADEAAAFELPMDQGPSASASAFATADNNGVSQGGINTINIRVSGEDYNESESRPFLPPSSGPTATGGNGHEAHHSNTLNMATSSPYRLARGERLRGVANRIIFSRYYVLFYGVMMVLSLTTVVLSLMARSESLNLYFCDCSLHKSIRRFKAIVILRLYAATSFRLI